MTLLDVLKKQRDSKTSGQIYELTQIEMAFNSNKIEGSTLTLRDASILYNEKIVPGKTKWNDVVEMRNHFEMFDYMLDTASEPLSETIIKRYHAILKNGTDDSKLDWFAVGDYKRVDNVVANSETTPAEKVGESMKKLIEGYGVGSKSFEEIVDFHVRFERIHPFQDGNGRVGRMIMFKECLRNNITPPIVLNRQKLSYMNGIAAYLEHPKKLLRTMEKFQKQYQKDVDKYVAPIIEIEEGERAVVKNGDIYVRPHLRNGRRVKGHFRTRPRRK